MAWIHSWYQEEMQTFAAEPAAEVARSPSVVDESQFRCLYWMTTLVFVRFFEETTLKLGPSHRFTWHCDSENNSWWGWECHRRFSHSPSGATSNVLESLSLGNTAQLKNGSRRNFSGFCALLDLDESLTNDAYDAGGDHGSKRVVYGSTIMKFRTRNNCCSYAQASQCSHQSKDLKCD